MRIGIIGANEIGITLARKLSHAGHSVKLANTDGFDVKWPFGDNVMVSVVTNEEAVKEVCVIILSIAFGQVASLAELFHTVPASVVVIDTSNYCPSRDGIIQDVRDGKAESVWVSEQIGRHVVKAWNTASPKTLSELGRPFGCRTRIALPVAGDVIEAEIVTQDLVEDTGFTALSGGRLIDSWRQQPGTPAYCTDLTLIELRSALIAADEYARPGIATL